jgi:hypothetical protein
MAILGRRTSQLTYGTTELDKVLRNKMGVVEDEKGFVLYFHFLTSALHFVPWH